MGKITYMISLLVLLNVMFMVFVGPTSNSPQGILFQIVTEAGGGLNESANLSWSSVSSDLVCNVDTTSVGGFLNTILNPINICGPGTLINILLRVLATTLAVTAGVTLATRATINAESLAWLGAGIFFLLSLGADFVYYFNKIANIHPPLTKIMALIYILPIALIYGMIVIDWARGRD